MICMHETVHALRPVLKTTTKIKHSLKQTLKYVLFKYNSIFCDSSWLPLLKISSFIHFMGLCYATQYSVCTPSYSNLLINGLYFTDTKCKNKWQS